jgi:stress response protein SCP2
MDSSLIMIDSNNDIHDYVWIGDLLSNDGSTTHTGDNTSGNNPGDDE